ncbi:MAG TPA: GNAT family N-acetyltransferase [Pseudomonadota bacterium]|nr:GNAT family N-acetyltransferase [Pseudomonadota bacterium]HNF99274.1 GNAT family N-acetyltransferase [Pseudomonadota bacterium]HNK44516.1 GNAT family N-acetyltransferase [Pseudomonadota bacterium]HNN52080.1 GNAT family N-acetyltransferase [Pseudomonadota bacterium]HNO67088.1 GNAT family N-acetyltransferase [Pseudomonadota bacterium]
MALHFQHKQVLSAELSALPHTSPRLPLIFRFGTWEDLQKQKGHPDYGYGAIPYLEGRLRAGDSFLLGELDGQLVMTAWLMRGTMELGELIVPIPKDHAYHYKLYTIEKFRRQGAARGLWMFLRERLMEQGIVRMISTVERRNTTSLHAHVQAGFRPLGSFAELQVGPMSGYVLSRALRRYLRDQRLPG